MANDTKNQNKPVPVATPATPSTDDRIAEIVEAKPETTVESPLTPAAVAPAAAPAAAPQARRQAIADAVAPTFSDPALTGPEPATVQAMVLHGSVRSGGVDHPKDSLVPLDLATAKHLETEGVVKIVRQMAG